MKIAFIVLGILAVVLASWALVNYLLQKRRQETAQRDGVVVYATVISMAPVAGWLKQLDLKKIVLRLQEPNDPAPREVVLQTRLAPGQRIVVGMKFAVVVDPKSPKRVYPAGPEAAKRLILTGSREERRQMKAQAAGRRPPAQRVVREPGSGSGPIPGMREKRR